MLKEYWNMNKKTYYLYFSLVLICIGLYAFLQKQAAYMEWLATPEVSVEDIETNPQSFYSLLFFTTAIGIVGFALVMIEIYLIIKPFLKKQLQQTALLGNNSAKYALLHTVFVVIVSGVGAVALYFADFTGVFSNDLTGISLIKEVFRNVAFPLWIMTIPLLLANGKVMSDLSMRKRMVLIIGGVLMLWMIVLFIHMFPNLNTLLFSMGTNRNLNIVQTTRAKIVDLFVDFVGIFAFVLAYNSFQKNYEVRVG